ncbi:hypothetical protein LTR97_009200 [Elasticomyces elasticus]|uniref:Uncharacterized protein n=1 Tax=Elasticomyces elasticus TaxID=574655 RepID=A0AAN7ZRZ4_9PEZI|nr:hypothetical protein LTR97_009200 [Elasticomyces elasticus]KAK5728353.1 hypothetical protein LTR15_001488 [Elasticomyces elasticus]
MEEHPRFSMMSEPAIEGSPTMPSDDMFSWKAGMKTPERPNAVKHFTDEPMFWRGYTSEEEVASPIENDGMSFRTTSTLSDISETASRLSSASFPEQLAHNCGRVEQQCNRAQAITLVPAGKVKVVSMPKLVDVSTTPRMRRPAPITPFRPPVSRMNRMEIGSQKGSQANNSPRTSTERSPVSTAPSSVAVLLTRGKSVRQRPSLPALQGTPRFQSNASGSKSTPRVVKTADFLQHDPYPALPVDLPITPPLMSPSRRKLHRFGSSIGLGVFGMRRSNSSDSSLDDALENVKDLEPRGSALPKSSSPRMLSRTPSTKPKMVARGANERAPPLILPPCPETYEDERDVTRWPLRKDASVLPMKLHKRQRTVRRNGMDGGIQRK